MAIPIWKDKFVDLGAVASRPFRIQVNGETIYNGNAHRRPGETNVLVRINDICADYLHNILPTLSQTAFTDLTFPLTFDVQKYSGSAWSSAESVEFLNDWSYDYAYNAATMGMAFPINGRIDARQWLTFTAYNASSLTATIHLKDGSSFDVIIPVEISADFNADFNNDFARSVRAAGSGTAVFDLSEWGDVAKVTIGSKSFDVVSDCAEWALYYVNAYGGWDSLLIEGLVSERDDLTRFTRKMEYDNRDIKNRGTQNYLNEIAKSYTLNTSWMSDEESTRMHHLLNSTEVYLYNIGTGEMVPVVLNNTTTEYKTYKSNGARLVNYQIDATVAQERIRR